MTSIKRSLVKTFLNTGTLVSPVWSLIGDGIKTGKIAYNPKISDETYIHQDSATIGVDSYGPKMPISGAAKFGDAVFNFIDALRSARSILDAAVSQVVNVWLYQTPANGYYYAELQSVTVSVDDFGGDGGVATQIGYTLDYIGDPVLGIFNPTPTANFGANPILTILTTLVLGSGTLSPLFATNHANLLYTTSIAAATVTMASTLSGATIVQKCNGTTVSQGAPASLTMGANILTIQVTVGTEVVTYQIAATRTV